MAAFQSFHCSLYSAYLDTGARDGKRPTETSSALTATPWETKLFVLKMSHPAGLQNRWAPQAQRNGDYNTDSIPLREGSLSQTTSTTKHHDPKTLPGNHNARRPARFSRRIHEDGESGRRGFHPFHFLHVCWMSSNKVSSFVNVLWPLVPCAIAVVGLAGWLHNITLGSQTYILTTTALRTPRPPRPDLHTKLHRHGSSCEHHWLRWTGARS